MATVRSHVRINRSPDEVWKVVSDSSLLGRWLSGVQGATVDNGVRRVALGGDLEIVEDIVTNDDAMHRFQYAITSSPQPITSHLATIDVLEDGDGALVIYSADLQPDESGPGMGKALERGCQGLKKYLESSD
jgi:carbon monoxide dehydrogenase subunit G